MTKDTEEFSQAVACRDTLCQETKIQGLEGNLKLGPYWKTCCLQGKYGVEIRLCFEPFSLMGQEWPEPIGHWKQQRTGNLRNAVRRINVNNWMNTLKPIKGQSKTTKTRTLAHPQEIPIGERTGLIDSSDYPVSKKLIHLLRHGSLPRDNDGAIEFWRIKDNLQKHFLYCHHWSDESGRAAWQEEEEKRKDFSIVLILQEQFCTSELFKVIQDAVLLILHYRTMSLFRTVSSSTFITSDVQSIYIPSSIQDWYREDKIWATDRQYSFCLWILWTKNTRILTRSTWKHRVLHNTCTKHGRNIKIRCIGSTSTLLWRKDWSSIKHDRTLSFFTKHSQLIVSRKLFGWKLEKSYTRRYMRHLGLLQRFPWNMTGWKIWVQKLLDNQKEKLRDKQKVPNQANQIQTQIMIERGNLLFALKEERPTFSGNRNTFFSWRSCEIR